MRLDVALAFVGLALLYLVIARWLSQTETRLVWAGLLCSRCPLPPSAPPWPTSLTLVAGFR